MISVLDSAPVAQSDVNPFKFLDYYTDSDRDRENFGGRDTEIRDVVAGILKHPIFVLHGRSGLGKTSLLLAGVFPELRACRYRPIHIRVLQDPVDDLRSAVAAALDRPIEANGSDALIDCIREAGADGPVVLVLDQFEEFFTRFREQAELRDRFTDVLGRLSGDASVPVRIVFSLREDYLAELDDLRVDLPELLAHSYRPIRCRRTGRAKRW